MTAIQTITPEPPKVLLVDDDQLILATLSRGLAAGGFTTVVAANGAEALRKCIEDPPSVAIIDYDMPSMTGLDVLRTLQSSAAFPVMMLSAYGDDTIVKEAVELGAMAYLVKPVDPSKLVPTIRAVIQRFAELAALRGESAQLSTALKAARATSVVVGLLMERLRLTEKQAYERLRQFCRSHNRRVTDVAVEILNATEQMNAVLTSISEHQHPAPAGRRAPSG